MDLSVGHFDLTVYTSSGEACMISRMDNYCNTYEKCRIDTFTEDELQGGYSIDQNICPAENLPEMSDWKMADRQVAACLSPSAELARKLARDLFVLLNCHPGLQDVWGARRGHSHSECAALWFGRLEARVFQVTADFLWYFYEFQTIFSPFRFFFDNGDRVMCPYNEEIDNEESIDILSCELQNNTCIAN